MEINEHKASEPHTEAPYTDDALLEQFFSVARTQEIADRGFTESVMRRLPDRALQLSRLWTLSCLVLSVVLFFVFDGWIPVVYAIVETFNTAFTQIQLVPLFVTMGTLCSLAVAEMAHRLYAGA